MGKNGEKKASRGPIVIAQRPYGGRGEILRISLERFRETDFVSLRKWYPGDGELLPGKGLSVHVGEIPYLVRALQLAETRALEEGLLIEEDFELADRPLPAALGGEAAA